MFAKVLTQKDSHYLFALLVFALPVVVSLIRPGYFPMHDDLQVMRLYEMGQCFADFQIPCRWVPDMSFGNGQPLFNFYPPFVYYLGSFFRFFGLSLIVTVKLLFVLGLILPAFFTFFLLRQFWQGLESLAGAVVSLYAPYLAVDVYVRGAMAESWALVLLPASLWAITRLVKEGTPGWIAATALAVGALFTSHNILALIAAPILVAWGLLLVFLEKQARLRSFGQLAIAGLWAGGISAFFTLPALVEKNLIKVENLTSGYFAYQTHFVTIRQLLFERSFGYGPSRFGPVDDLSFQAGWPHWWLAFLAVGVGLFLLMKKKREVGLVTLFFAALFWGSLFATHARSFYLWNFIPTLAYVQFPWRFLSLAILASGGAAASLLGVLPTQKWKFSLAAAIMMLAVGFNFAYFRPVSWFTYMTDQIKLSGADWRSQVGATLLDYLPRTAEVEPLDLAPEQAEVIGGLAFLTKIEKTSRTFSFKAQVKEDAVLEIPVIDFPGWTVFVNGEKVDHGNTNRLGRIQLGLEEGNYLIEGKFGNTPVRTAGNLISLLSLLGLSFYTLGPERGKIWKRLKKF